MFEGKHVWVYWSCTCKTVSSEKETFPKHTMRSGLLSLLTRKVILYELWSSQYCCEMIELADSRVWSANSVLSCAESVREVHTCRLPCDFPIKSGCRIYFINVGICLLMCSRELCCVLDFGDCCSWKHNFGVGKYGKGKKLNKLASLSCIGIEQTSYKDINGLLVIKVDGLLKV